MCEPQHPRTSTRYMAAKSKSPVVVTLPHANAIARRVETHQRQQHQAQRTRWTVSSRAWFGDAIEVAAQGFAFPPTFETQTRSTERLEYREVAVLAAALGLSEQQGGI